MHLRKKLVNKYREGATDFEHPKLSSVNVKEERLTQAEGQVEPEI